MPCVRSASSIRGVTTRTTPSFFASGLLVALRKMGSSINLVGKGDKAGSGFDVLRRSARYAGVDDPVLTESYDPDRVALVLRLATGGLSLGFGEDRRRPAETGGDRRRFRIHIESGRRGNGIRA